MDREPAAWETNAAGPFLSIGEVGVYALGQDRFRVVAPDCEREGEGFEPARQLAHELAGSHGWPTSPWSHARSTFVSEPGVWHDAHQALANCAKR